MSPAASYSYRSCTARMVAATMSLLLASCVEEGPLAPASTGATLTPPSPGGAGGAAAPATRKRVVQMRNPFGGPAGNLLVDGDFELSATSGGNLPGWLAFRWDGGQETLVFETGGLCRSGLRCAIARANVSYLGWGTAARRQGMSATIWAKVPAGSSCEIVTPVLTKCWYATGTELVSAAFEPDDSGWCRYEGGFSHVQETSACLYVEAELGPGEVVLLDQAQLLPATGAVPMSAAAQPLDELLQSRVQTVLDQARALRPFGQPRPDSAAFNRD